MASTRIRPLRALRVLALCLVAAGLVLAQAPESRAGRAKKKPPKIRPHVVVATLDTGTNPFHPTWRRDQFAHPSTFIPGFPASAPALNLSFEKTYEESVLKSKPALDDLRDQDRHPYWIPGTNIIGTWAHESDMAPVFDTRGTGAASHSHGAQASSQIAGLEYGLAPDAYIVIMDRTPDGGNANVYNVNAEGLRWAADQPWIDIIHTNIQNPIPLANESTPVSPGFGEAVSYALSKGKIVVSAGGNFYGEFTETSPHAGPPGVLVAGANDNCGYADFSNPDPHIVMDGLGTVSAAPTSYEDASFGGTSSASPRITGYVASLLLRLRERFNYTGGITDGSLLTVPEATRPKEGPLADGKLTGAELHEVVRKTADPNPHESMWDGALAAGCIPQPVDLPFAFYPKMGYGEVSEHTFGAALDVALGQKPMPQREMEDRFYEQSEDLRRRFWGQ